VKKHFSIIFLLFLFVSLSAQIDSYTFKRKINPVEKESYYSIPLLTEVVAKCKSNLNDIRLYKINENDTIEIPYLIERMGAKVEQSTIPFEIINNSHNEKCCSYLTLKFNKKQIINQIKLDVSETNFDKILKLEGSNDNKEWFTIKDHLRIVGFQNQDENYKYTTLDFKNSEYSYFRLKFDDDDGSQRITVNNAYAYKNRGNYSELKINKWKQTENKKTKNSEIIVELPFNYLVNYLTVKSDSKNNFYRNINVYRSETYSTPAGEKENWYLINTSVFSSIENNSIYCNNVQTKKIKIEIINYNDEPIHISEIKAYCEQCKLTVNLQAASAIYLAYGKENDNAPIYDIEHFKENIPAALSEIN
jgi:hypothetical protein